MPKSKTLEEAYDECACNGQFIDQEVINKERIMSMLDISKANADSAEMLKKIIGDKSHQ